VAGFYKTTLVGAGPNDNVKLSSNDNVQGASQTVNSPDPQRNVTLGGAGTLSLSRRRSADQHGNTGTLNASVAFGAAEGPGHHCGDEPDGQPGHQRPGRSDAVRSGSGDDECRQHLHQHQRGADPDLRIANTAGTFQLTFNGQTTVPIAYSATPATLQANIQAALDTLRASASVTRLVTAVSATTVTVTFRNGLGSQLQPNMGTAGLALTAAPTPSRSAPRRSASSAPW